MCVYISYNIVLEMLNRCVGLKLEILKLVEIEIKLSFDPPKFVLVSNGLG